jgi:hypothetical protein
MYRVTRARDALKPVFTRGSTSIGRRRRIATRLWRCSTKPLPLGALEVVGD